MVVFPTAKINFGLNIINRRDDGYHNIESIFYPIGICDALEIVRASNGSSFKLSGIPIEGPQEQNLVWKVWVLMQERFDLPPAHIRLVKHIPMGAGIGGGSADAGFFINLVNDCFRLGLSTSEREALALQAGSDCPFFIENKPALVQGRGEVLSPVPPFLAGYFLVLVYGDFPISTREAYAAVQPEEQAHSLLDIMSHPAEWREKVKNDFEPVVSRQYPGLTTLKEKLYAEGAVYASLSGTGSCVYGIFTGPIDFVSPVGSIVWKGWL